MAVKRANRHYKGLATVEAAIVFPLLLVLTIGIINYGLLFLRAQQITNAARHGARLAVLPSAELEEVRLEEVRDAIAILMADAGISGYDPPNITGISGSPGSHVTVSLSVNTTNLTLIDTLLMPVPETLGASVTMAKEGP